METKYGKTNSATPETVAPNRLTSLESPPEIVPHTHVAGNVELFLRLAGTNSHITGNRGVHVIAGDLPVRICFTNVLLTKRARYNRYFSYFGLCYRDASP